MELKTIKQSELSSECWLIQIWRPGSCGSCDVKNTKECGGKKIRKTGKNEKNFMVPLNNN